jgi:hypothetical protein
MAGNQSAFRVTSLEAFNCYLNSRSSEKYPGAVTILTNWKVT